jgi:hypothetical protein
MGKNIIPGIAKMLGVKIGEEFKVNSLYEQMIFKFADNVLLGRIDVEGSIWTPAYVVLSNLLGGDVEIIKLPWKPKESDIFYTFDFTYGKWGVKPDMWAGAPCDYALLGEGWVYRTRAEAEAALPVVAAKLGVEYEI